ncbi:MAG TPA: oligosaccharide flippase family protein [Candidatus Sulfotelmatobacter sp.]
MATLPEAEATASPAGHEVLRGHVVRGSAILLLSTGLVAATNLLYNILIARMLGAAGFGHATALYTLLMLVTAVTLSFQIVTSKFIARNPETLARAQIYAALLRRAWRVGIGVAGLLAAGSAYLQSYLNLPAQHDLILLAVAAGVYIPLGVRRGRMQGCYHFSGLALNVVVEVVVKLAGAMLFLHFGMGVTGVMTAILLSIVAAYLAGQPGPQYRAIAGKIKIAPFGEGMQAILYFAGQVILSNLDILLVKHFFPPSTAGIYAAVALVGRVVFMLSWSVVSSMFPVSASHSQRQSGRPVLHLALLLVAGLTSAFIVAIALAPEAVWTMLLGKQFLLGTVGPFSALLTEYAVMTGIYSIAVVVMMYEISRRISAAAWVQLGASVLVAGGIWSYHNSLSQVILVQLFVMCGLLVAVTVPLFRGREESVTHPSALEPLRRLRRVPEEEIVAEFLRGEFCHPEFDSYRRDFRHLVDQGDLENPRENFIRRALLFLRRGRLWRELPAGTEWWEVELTHHDLERLQSFPRNEWRRFAGGGFYLTEMVGRIEAEMARGRQSRFLKKLGEIAIDLRGSQVPDGILLIGMDEYQPLTIIEGNHRIAAAMLTMPESAHRRFRFYCGLSPNMNTCCWHKTDLRSLTRYARHTVQNIFHDMDALAALSLREKLAEIEAARKPAADEPQRLPGDSWIA